MQRRMMPCERSEGFSRGLKLGIATCRVPRTMPHGSRPCHVCGGGDDEGLILLCEGCDVPVHAHCLGFNGPLGNGWLCRVCKDQAAVSESHESEGVADFTIGPRDWPGTYLEWLNEDLLRLIFGPLQLRCALAWVRFRVVPSPERDPDHVPSAKELGGLRSVLSSPKAITEVYQGVIRTTTPRSRLLLPLGCTNGVSSQRGNPRNRCAE